MGHWIIASYVLGALNQFNIKINLHTTNTFWLNSTIFNNLGATNIFTTRDRQYIIWNYFPFTLNFVWCSMSSVQLTVCVRVQSFPLVDSSFSNSLLHSRFCNRSVPGKTIRLRFLIFFLSESSRGSNNFFQMSVIYMPTPTRDSYLICYICDRYKTVPSIKKMNSTHSLLMSLTMYLPYLKLAI